MILSGLLPDQNQEVAGVSRRRRLGVYYTPDDLAAVLVRWALANSTGPVLDPSYGGCAFLEAAVRILTEKDHARPGRRVYGVDIDPSCADTVRRSKHLIEANCIQGDFLAASPRDLPGNPFAAIVGNPPYVRHHWIKGDQRESARAVAADSTIPLPGTASLWVYFLLHSLKFLSPRGRLAMLVPEAILQADYAGPLRQILSEKFGRSLLIYVRSRLFAGTDEPVVAVACAEFGERGDVRTMAVESVDDLQSALADSNGHHLRSYRFPGVAHDVRATAISVLSRIRETPSLRRLADVATVRVGLVTGANHYFIRSRQDLDSLGLPPRVRHRIVSRTRWLTGLAFTERDHDTFVDGEAAAFLVRPEHAEDDQLVESWIREGINQGIEGRYKCAARAEWFRVEMPPPPDAFATCTRAGSPLLVLNRGECQSSNAIHNVRWKPNLSVAPEAVAVGFLTSAVSAWAELSGRRYGGGVLKIEPGTLQRIPVPLVPGAEDAFTDVDRLVRNGREEEAREFADQRVLRKGLGLPNHEIDSLRQTRSILMKWRRPSRAYNGHA